METKNQYLIPGAIVIAGLLIAATVFYVAPKDRKAPTTQKENNKEYGPENIRPVTREDHILGDLNAPVVIVVFSDLECPFCKSFHETMKQIMETYGPEKVAWVYRHFPLTSIHPKAPAEAEATECANELGGPVKFWEYMDRIFSVTPSNNRLDLSLLPQMAQDIGLNRSLFETCLQSRKYKARVEADAEDAIQSGGQGTPYSIVIAKDGSYIPIGGALEFEKMKQVVDQALALP